MPMLLAFCDAAFRVAILIALALVPYAAPVEIAPAASAAIALARLMVFAALMGASILVVRYWGAADKPLTFALVATLVVASVAAFVLRGERGPLARGVWYVAPFVWGMLALAASSGTRLRAAQRAARTSAWGSIAAMGVLAVGAASLLSSREALRPTAELWQRTLRADPGNEAASLATARQLREGGDRAKAHELLVACAKAHPLACPCEEGAASDAIDLGRYEEARAELEAPTACPRTPQRIGLTAEALVGANAIADGVRQAELALQADPNEAHAAYARAWAVVRQGGDLREAQKLATLAVQLQRGTSAELLLGQIDFQLGDLDAAARLFQTAAKSDPSNADAAYDVALIAQKRGEYHDAREGYLRALRLNPAFADARYNLVGLTLGVGAIDEAQHHLDQLAAKNPTDPRIAAMQAAIARTRGQGSR